jgi:hypothetical protein
MTLIDRFGGPLLSIALVFAFESMLSRALAQQRTSPSQQTQSQGLPHSSQPEGARPPNASLPPNSHMVTVNFDYDFTRTPACSPKVSGKNCIKQFDVYDISGKRYKLFSIPAPAGASGVVKSITGESPRRVFEPGKHIIAVTAEDATGTESEVTGSKVTVVIPLRTLAPADSSPTVTKP